MVEFIGFIVGFIIGGITGVFVMAMLQVSSERDGDECGDD